MAPPATSPTTSSSLPAVLRILVEGSSGGHSAMRVSASGAERGPARHRAAGWAPRMARRLPAQCAWRTPGPGPRPEQGTWMHAAALRPAHGCRRSTSRLCRWPPAGRPTGLQAQQQRGRGLRHQVSAPGRGLLCRGRRASGIRRPGAANQPASQPGAGPTWVDRPPPVLLRLAGPRLRQVQNLRHVLHVPAGPDRDGWMVALAAWLHRADAGQRTAAGAGDNRARRGARHTACPASAPPAPPLQHPLDVVGGGHKGVVGVAQGAVPDPHAAQVVQRCACGRAGRAGPGPGE